MASSTPARKPGASVLKPISSPDADRATLLTAPIIAASASTVSQSPATSRLYGAVTWSPSQSGPRASSTAPSTAVGLQLEQLVVRVDAGRRECGVVHDLRVASLERLADEGDAPGHRQGDGGRRTGPTERREGDVRDDLVDPLSELVRIGRHRVQEEVLDPGVHARLQ